LIGKRACAANKFAGYRFVNPDYRRNYSKVIITGKALQKRLKDVRDGARYPGPETPQTHAGGAGGGHAR
jgi:hypothetical protein